jgi:hypothetical protein
MIEPNQVHNPQASLRDWRAPFGPAHQVIFELFTYPTPQEIQLEFLNMVFNTHREMKGGHEVRR